MKTPKHPIRILPLFILGGVIGLGVAVLTTCAPDEIAGVSASAPPIRLIELGSKATWSPGGRQVIFSGAAGSGLQRLDLRTRTATALQVQGMDPAWSPAGSMVAFVRHGSYDTPSSYLREEVWLLPLPEGPARRVVRGGFPGWSVDGKVLYVHSRVDNQILALNVTEPDAAPTVFFAKPTSWYFTVAPDGRRVAFGARGQLEVRDRETGEVTVQWPTPNERGLLPAWSPDGELVAFGGFNGSRLGVWILEVRTGRAARVVEGLFTMPAWSGGGRWLAFDERAGGRDSVWLVGRPHLDQLLEQASDAGKP